MQLRIVDHAAFQRAAVRVIVTAALLAAAAALAGWQRLPPRVVVLAGAMATLALALGHTRLVLDAAGDVLARAASAAPDAEGRALLRRVAVARAELRAAVRGEARLSALDRQALDAAVTMAAAAVGDAFQRRGRLAARLRAAAAPEAAAQLQALEARGASTADPAAREAYGRAAAALRDRVRRAAGLEAVMQRTDARLCATVAELEGAALALATRDDLDPGEAGAALTAACERLRAAHADLGAECDALAEVGGL